MSYYIGQNIFIILHLYLSICVVFPENTFFIVFIYRQFSLSLVRQNIFLENLDSNKQNVELECLGLGIALQ